MKHDPRSLSERTAGAGIWLVAGKLASKAIDFLLLLILARLLGPQDFGLVAMALTVVLIVEAVLELPLMQSLVRVTDPSVAMFDTALTLGLLRGLVIAALLGALAWPVAALYQEPRLTALLLVLGLGPVMRGMMSPRMVLFMQRLDFRREAALDITGKTLALLVAAGLALGTGSYWAIAAGTVTTPVVTSSLSYVLAPHRPRLTLSEWHRFADMVGWNSLYQLFSAINWQMDKLMLGRFLEPGLFGRFSLANDLATIPYQAILVPLLRPLMAGFAPLAHAPEALGAAYCKASNAVVFVTGPLLLGLALMAGPAVRLALGPQWIEVAPMLTWLALCGLMPLPVRPMQSLAMVLDRTRYTTLQIVLEFAFKLPATLLGILWFGIWGAIVARALANLVVIVVSGLIVRRLIGLSLGRQAAAVWRPAAALVPMAGVLLAGGPWLAGIPVGVGLVAACALLAGAAMLVFLAVTLGLWRVFGRPGGIEAVVVARAARLPARVLRRR
ncbi:lipopolysaccharide biosynthesis protein (plasmid) [Paroceanicella profunda]|uniref:Lipopolysaccharide biosynthesis protein n=1 Tax=Paroceanicella profunda TaxID=2579971 RepID=A0A5B8G0T3_9RHOB|nr:oligosaccharide flippase family protein [Paroceanicella profunda]QDL94736.1 lipopolysaccharide biosynthesis protein [Paroceanicella profunda]